MCEGKENKQCKIYLIAILLDIFTHFSISRSYYALDLFHSVSLRKHTYSKISPLKTVIFQIKKNSDSFHISAQNIDCWYSLEPPRRGGSNEYQQSMWRGGSNEYQQSMF